MYQPNRDTYVPTNPFTEYRHILATKHQLVCTNKTNTHMYPQTFICRKTTEHRHILQTKHKLLCTNPTNTHTYQSEHRHIPTTKHRLICTNKTETHMYQQNLYALRTDFFGHTWRSPDHFSASKYHMMVRCAKCAPPNGGYARVKG